MKWKITFAPEVDFLKSAEGLHDTLHVGLGRPPNVNYRNPKGAEQLQAEE